MLISNNFPTLRQALSLGAAGFLVFPCVWPIFDAAGGVACSCKRGADCDTPGKHPAIRGWQAEATSDADEIKFLWRNFERANIGIRPDGFQVLDFDDLRAVTEWNLSPTWTVRSGRSGGGQHRYYRLPEGVELSNADLCHGIDTRGHKGFVVGPGSLHPSGQHYELIDDRPMAPLPADILELLQAKQREVRSSTPSIQWDPQPAPTMEWLKAKLRPEYVNLIIFGETLERGKALSRVYRAMECAGFSRGEIFGVCSDPKFGISAKHQLKGDAWLAWHIDRVLDWEKRSLTLAELFTLDVSAIGAAR